MAMDESDESYDPILPDEVVPPKRAAEPPPLKRLWKAPEEPDDADQPAVSKAKKKVVEEPPPKPRAPKPLFIKKKKPEPAFDDGTGASKLEETPVLDTVEARQRARWLIGGLIAAIGCIFIIVVVGAFKGGENQDIKEGEPPDLRTVSETRVDTEVEARTMLENAKKADRMGKTAAAVNLLIRLTKTYPSTAASREAQQAIDRNRDHQPLFATEDQLYANGPSKPPESGPKPPTVTAQPPSVVATAPEPPKTPDATAKVQPPVIPAAPTIAIKPLPVGYRPNYDAPIHPSGWPTRIHADRDGGEMVLVPGGVFDMGREDGEPQERPLHRVRLSTYYIDMHEVTINQFSTYLKESGRSLDAVKKSVPKGVNAAAAGDYPIVNISAKEAKAFCTWAKRTLPTEAQWEMAARSTEGRISFWNEQLPRPDPAKGPRVMEAVMTLPSDLSVYGAFDMGANAWEWTSEYYDSQYYMQFRNLVDDPTGPKESRASIALVTVKGGSKSGILTWREGIKPESRLSYLGFRGALSVEAPVVNPATTRTPTPPPASGPGSSPGVVPF